MSDDTEHGVGALIMGREKMLRRRGLTLERLEDRSLLAGNVLAEIRGGALIMRGDSQGNEVQIEQASDNSLLLTPLDGTTTINGSVAPVLLSGYRGRVVLAAGAGNDYFRFDGTARNFSLGTTANLDLGAGNDMLELFNTTTGRALVINAGPGHDFVDLRNSDAYVGVLIGGPGFDLLNRVGNHFRHGPVIVQFEQRTFVGGPITSDDTATVEEGGMVTIDVAANDTAGGEALDLDSIVITEPPANGTLAVNAAGTVTYTHDGTETTSDSFRYTIADEEGQVSNEAQVNIAITPIDDTPPTENDPPVISDVADVMIQEDSQLGPFSITIGDDMTAAGDLTLSAASSNTALVPNANIALGGSGTTRTILATPVAGASGETTITLTVTDDEGVSTTDTFVLTVDADNDSPTISAVADQTTNVDTQIGPLSFTIGDEETAAGDLEITATSSNQIVVANGGIQLGGSGSSRTVLITPEVGATGTTTVTLTVTDEGNVSTTETFVVTVNGAPTIAAVSDVAIDANSQAGPIDVTIDDDLTAAASLMFTATSDNPALLPAGGIQLGGSGTARTLLLTPLTDASGTANITLTVTDQGGLTATDTFTLTVNPLAEGLLAAALPPEGEHAAAVDAILAEENNLNDIVPPSLPDFAALSVAGSRRMLLAVNS